MSRNKIAVVPFIVSVLEALDEVFPDIKGIVHGPEEGITMRVERPKYEYTIFPELDDRAVKAAKEEFIKVLTDILNKKGDL